MTDGNSPAIAIHQLAMSLIGGALAGKVLGFVREVAMAHVLGVSIVADSFRGAMTAVLLPLALLQGDTVPAVLIPLHRQWQAERRAAQCFASLTVVLLIISFALTALVELFAGTWARVLVSGFSPQAQILTSHFVRVLALAMPAQVLVNCLISVELSLGRPRLASVRAAAQNVGLLMGIVAMVVTGDVLAIAWGFTLAYTAIAVWGGLLLVRERELSLSGARLSTAIHAVSLFLLRLRAMVAQPIAEQAQTWLERFLASASASGTVAALDYARTLTDTASFVVSQPLGLAVLADNVSRSRQDARRRVAAIARPLLIIAMPASTFMVLFAPDIVQEVFARGAFGVAGMALTSPALAGISTGLWAATLGLVLVRQLNSEGRNGAAALVLVMAYAVNMAFNLAAVPRLGALGIGLGEAVRGIAMLSGAALAVRGGRVIFRLVLQALPGCIALWPASIAVHGSTDSPLLRLTFGMLAFLVIIGAMSAVLVPDMLRRATRWVGGRFGAKMAR